MNNESLEEYWAALDRLVGGNTIILPHGTPVSYDSVALEAGRGRGSLKATRPQHQNIRDAILRAATAQTKATTPVSKASLKRKAKDQYDSTLHYKKLYNQTLARELMLLQRIAELEDEIEQLRGLRVVPFKRPS